ncbi:MAG: hypothetical protein LBE67_04635 [Kocuria palustris]|nr:hypothetical protein [Kocuria palustris]
MRPREPSCRFRSIVRVDIPLRCSARQRNGASTRCGGDEGQGLTVCRAV